MNVFLNPFTKNRTARFVLFLGNDYPIFGEYIRDREDELRSIFLDEGYVFLSVEDIEASLDDDMMQYMFPWREPYLFNGRISLIIKEKYNVGDKAGLLCIKGKKTSFYPIGGRDILDVDKAIDKLLRQLSKASGPATEHLMPMAEQLEFPFDEIKETKRKPRVVAKQKGPSLFKKLWIQLEEEQREKDSLESSTKDILRAWEDFSNKYNISIEELAALLDDDLKISRLTIRPSGTILLTDYDNREVRMDDLTKALYFLYLLHPKGIRQKDLIDYKDELLDIYLRITPRDDLDEIKVSVDSLLFDDNRINVSLSRIKKTFRDIFGEWVAKHYYVDGKAGEARSVKLDRDLVIWEH